MNNCMYIFQLTNLIKVTNDLIITSDSNKTSILVLLGLTCACDTNDHDILIQRLQVSVCLAGTVLNWFVNDRTFHVSIGVFKSSGTNTSSGVAQGSVLGPLLFNLCMLPLGTILSKHSISYHSYADDTQMYISLSSDDLSPVSRMVDCINDINCWMSGNFLQLNTDKTESTCWS